MSDETQPTTDGELGILDYLLPLVKWRWLIFAGTVCAALAGGYYALSVPQVYTATAYFVPRGSFGETNELESFLGPTGRNWRSVTNASEIAKYYGRVFTTRPVMEALVQTPFRSEKKNTESLLADILEIGAAAEEERFRQTVSKIQNGLAVRSSGGKVISLSFTASEAQLSAGVVNAVLEIHAGLSRADRRSSTTLNLIQGRLDDSRSKLTRKGTEIAKLRSKILDSSPDAAITIQAMEREARLLETLVETLVSEYAKAEIRQIQRQHEEGAAEFDVIDRATAPLRASGLSRRRIALTAAMLGALLTAGFAWTFEYFRRLRRLDEGHLIWSHLRGAARDLMIFGALLLLALVVLVAGMYL